MKALIVFDSKHGTTAEIACRIAEAVASNGCAADLLDLRKKGSASAPLADYDAVALGGPFYMGTWSKRARSFASARESELAGKAFGLFAVGSNAELGDKAAAAALPASLADSISASAYLGGRFDIDKASTLERFIIKKVTGKAESSSTLDFAPIEGFGKKLAKAASLGR
jgi:menaquinone-dependent protoporphyrinogen IX oxidase